MTDVRENGVGWAKRPEPPLETRRTRGRLYIAGPMRGRQWFNFPKFARTAARLREYGYEVISPAEMDQEIFGWGDHPTEEDLLRDGFDVEEALIRDFQAINRCDGVALLPGWRASEGARREIVHARMQDRTIYEYVEPDGHGFWLRALKDNELPTVDPTPNLTIDEKFVRNTITPYEKNPYFDLQGTPPNPALDGERPAQRPPFPHPTVAFADGETRIVDPTTGGAKGQKLARFDLLPADVLWELAEHFGKGEAKYPSPDDGTGRMNWQLGYPWRLSIGALERHLSQWKQGEEFDAETESSHLVAVAWHALVLRWFQLHGAGTDTRLKAADVA